MTLAQDPKQVFFEIRFVNELKTWHGDLDGSGRGLGGVCARSRNDLRGGVGRFVKVIGSVEGCFSGPSGCAIPRSRRRNDTKCLEGLWQLSRVLFSFDSGGHPEGPPDPSPRRAWKTITNPLRGEVRGMRPDAALHATPETPTLMQLYDHHIPVASSHGAIQLRSNTQAVAP